MTVVAIVLYVTLATPEIVQITIPTAVQLYSPSGNGSAASFEAGNIKIKLLSRERNILVSGEEDPFPPRPELPGGSR